MSSASATARAWTCDHCGVSASRIDGCQIEFPETWASSADGQFCLVCRRERAGNAALESAPSDSPLDARAKLRRAAVIEFEVRRTPEHANNAIAKACRSSAAAVAEVRRRLELPDPPPRGARPSG
jgi:hypothetical protein